MPGSTTIKLPAITSTRAVMPGLIRRLLIVLLIAWAFEKVLKSYGVATDKER